MGAVGDALQFAKNLTKVTKNSITVTFIVFTVILPLACDGSLDDMTVKYEKFLLTVASFFAIIVTSSFGF